MSRLNSAYLQWLTGTKMYTSELWECDTSTFLNTTK